MTEQEQLTSAPSSRRLRVRAIATIGLMIAFSLAILQLDFSTFGEYGYLGLFVIVLLGNATVIIPAPAFVTAFAAGRTLNPWLVGGVSGVAAGLGETTGYLIGRAGRAALGDRQRFTRIVDATERWGALAVFFFAAIPNPIMDLAGMAAGAMRMPYWKFLLACCAGKTLRFTVLALLGSGFGR